MESKLEGLTKVMLTMAQEVSFGVDSSCLAMV